MLISEKGVFPITEKFNISEFNQILLRKKDEVEPQKDVKIAPEQLQLFDT